jgi:uncharacterized phiE125 gp8 family phage protein
VLSAPVVIEPATVEPVSVDQVKVFLRIDGGALDPELELICISAREDLELMTGLRLIDQVVRVLADSVEDLAHLTVGPVQQLVAIGAVTPDGEVEPAPIDGFALTGADLDRGVRAIGSWPQALLAGPIAVDLAVGYGAAGTNVPATLRLAQLLLVRARHDDRPVDLERMLVNLRINA